MRASAGIEAGGHKEAGRNRRIQNIDHDASHRLVGTLLKYGLSA
jgi:hypothetical protein